ncbi:MAG: class I SAM-dependent methyltransferase [Stellaceae bacterium]
MELFSSATHWKRYFASVLAPFIGPRVLEVGAGVGSNLAYLRTPAVRDWVSLEPDPKLARRIGERIASGELPPAQVAIGTTAEIDPAGRFDTVLYLDVLEHIADDKAEIDRAARLLAPGGHVAVLAPAHQSLFSPFDAAVGHVRRYSASSLRALAPLGCRLERCLMLDTAGLVASLANRLLLRQSAPSAAQIALWDGFLVPISRWLDPMTGWSVGKSVVAVWRRPA